MRFLFMAALWNGAEHHIFVLWFLLHFVLVLVLLLVHVIVIVIVLVLLLVLVLVLLLLLLLLSSFQLLRASPRRPFSVPRSP